MSSDQIKLVLTKRETVGNQVKALRRSGIVPAVIHNHGKESTLVQAPYVALTKVYAAAGKHAPIELDVEGKGQLGIIKEVDLDPYKNTIRHIVFNSIRRDEKVKAEIPIELIGDEVPAEKAGYLIIPILDSIEVEALPHNLPETVQANKEKLVEVGDKITVSDLFIPEGVTILTEQEHTIAAVEESKAQISEEGAAEDENTETEDTDNKDAESQADSGNSNS